MQCASCGRESEEEFHKTPAGDMICTDCAVTATEEAMTLEREINRRRLKPMLIIFIVGLLSLIFYARLDKWQRIRGSEACRENRVVISRALHSYAADHKGVYPSTLQELKTGGYIRDIPTCPSSRKDTYSSVYHRETGECGCSVKEHNQVISAQGKDAL